MPEENKKCNRCVRKSDSTKTCLNCGRMMCINTIPLLSNLTEDEIDQISAGVSTHLFKKGERVFSHGQTADKLYIICRGKLKIYKYAGDGREQILYILSEGDFIGAFNLLKADHFDFFADALEDTEISMLEKASFDMIVLANPTITLKIFEKAYERIIKAEKLVERLSANNPDGKVASLLINLMDDFGENTPEGILLNLSINREEMGSYAGIARETMSRKLQNFQEEGLIRLSGSRKILICSLEGLKEKSLL